MRKVKARSLLQFSTTELWDIIPEDFIMVFDDGVELITTIKECLFSSYFWDFHRRFNNLPLLKTHHVKSVLKHNTLSVKNIGNIFTNIYSDLIVYYDLTKKEKDDAARMIFEINNDIYNSLIVRAEAFVVGLDITDFIEVAENDVIKTAMIDVEKTYNSVVNTYKLIENTIYNDKSLINNPIVKSAKARTINSNQLMQCIGPRGRLTDIDSMIFDIPITRSYLQGIVGAYDSFIESRSAAKSLFFAEDPLKDAEYFSRKLQLLTLIVENIHYGDCGSQNYLLWPVRGKDLPNIVGIYYLDEESGKVISIKETDTHLIGKTIKMRSVVAGCNHPDPHGICSVCFGTMSENIPINSNIGHNSSATMNQQITQNTMSNKHVDVNASGDNLNISAEVKAYISVLDNAYYLNDVCKTLYINSQCVIGINDIELVNDVRDLNSSRISNIDVIGIGVNSDNRLLKEKEILAIHVEHNNRRAMFTTDFLIYIKQNGWIADTKNNFIFDLSKWDYTKPVLLLPNKQYDMSAHGNNISKIIEARVEQITERENPESPASTLIELFDLVNSKLEVNLSLLNVIVYASMIVSYKDKDFRLPKPWTNKQLGVASITIPNRSLGAAYAYEDLAALMVKPSSFMLRNRQDSPMDAFINPECVEYYKSI